MALLALALITTAALGGSTVFRSGPHFPSRWDPRLASIVKFVERYRGHTFKHPVSVYFLSDDQYKKIAKSDDAAKPTAKERQDAADSVAEYRAMGLMTGAPDLLAAGDTLFGEGTLAYYSPTSKIVNIKGTEMSVSLRVTLAHELTHALQDQYFDLSKLQETSNSDKAGAIRSVIEGDATSTERAYVGQLSDAERSEYMAQNSQDVDEANTNLSTVPSILQTQFGGLYELGRGFVELLQSNQGADQLVPLNADQALARPPASSSQLFEAPTYFNRTPVVSVTAPKQKGTRVETGSFGASLLFLMLSERIPPAKAMIAVDGWRGDAYDASRVSSGNRKRLCLDAEVATDSATDATELRLALAAWSNALPAASTATVSSDTSDHRVRFTTCDPGATSDVKLTGQSNDAMNYPLTRLEVAAALVRGDAPRDSAWCVSTHFVETLTPSDLTQSGGAEIRQKVQAGIAAARQNC